MIGSLNKVFSRNFVVGCVLPTLLLFYGISTIFPENITRVIFEGVISDKNNSGEIALILLSILVVSIALSIFNVEIYRVVEGYSWPIILFKYRRGKYIKINTELQNRCDDLGNEYKKALDANSDIESIENISKEYKEIILKSSLFYPKKIINTLPTKFGNIIRSFEQYPNDQYGADGVVLWPFVESVMSNDERSIIESFKSNVDFFINIFIYSIICTILSSIKYIYIISNNIIECGVSAWFISNARDLFFSALDPIVTIAVFIFVAFISYRFSLIMALRWGRRVRVAFDLNLPAVASRLKVEFPKGIEESRKVWEAISQRTHYLRTNTEIVIDYNKE